MANLLPQKLQLTLCLIKPDITPIACKTIALRKLILKKGFYFIRSRCIKLSQEDAEKFYHQHKDRFFFYRLVTFMSSGPLWAHILAHPDAVKQWRAIMGPTKVYKAVFEAPRTIRGLYGLTDTRNAVHGSDSESSAREEIGFYFKDFSFEDWKLHEENQFNHRDKIIFDAENCIHKFKP
ncbi:nucleoside diphosphate kinase 6-like [Tetranychus urticae]|uniref:Nucleoside diphosphate kinase n=1 Tax=Tetranychus urticae TaxID=32264 RepID=T1KXT3_TETUR|nr:nucleoside diphosphate kinase 6-like [Tetranychus urticae]